MTYNDQGVYLAFRNHESQVDKLVPRFTQRGSPPYQDDDIEVFVQPAGSKRVCQFAVKALGTQSGNLGNSSDWRVAATGAQLRVAEYLPPSR